MSDTTTSSTTQKAYDAIKRTGDPRRVLGAITEFQRDYAAEIKEDQELAARIEADRKILESGKRLPALQVVTGVEFDERPAPKEKDKVNAINVGRYRFISKSGVWYDVDTGLEFQPQNLYAQVNYLMPKDDNGRRVKPYDYLTTGANGANIYADYQYVPGGLPEIVEHGVKFLNTWRHPGIEPKEGDASPILKLVEHLYGGDEKLADQAIDYFAYHVQNPRKRARWAPLHIAPKEGMGRGTLVRMLYRIFGEHNCTQVRNQQGIRRGLFMQNRRFVCVPETKIPGVDLANSLKPLISDDWVEITPMRCRGYDILNTVCWFFMSNEEAAIRLTKFDRRFFVHRNEGNPLALSFYKELNDWIDGDGAAIFLHHLMHRDLSNFDPSRAPMTEDKLRLAENNVDDGVAILTRMIERREPPFDRLLVRLTTVQSTLTAVITTGPLRDVKQWQLRDALRACGGKDWNEKVGKAGERERFWSTDPTDWKDATPEGRERALSSSVTAPWTEKAKENQGGKEYEAGDGDGDTSTYAFTCKVPGSRTHRKIGECGGSSVTVTERQESEEIRAFQGGDGSVTDGSNVTGDDDDDAPFDWSEVHEQLAQAQQRNAAAKVQGKQRRKILKARAQSEAR